MRSGAALGLLVGTAIAAVAVVVLVLTGQLSAVGGKINLLLAIPAYLVLGVYVGGACSALAPRIASGYAAYAAGVVFGVPVVLVLRVVVRGLWGWDASDGVVLGVLLLAFTGPVAVKFWSDPRINP